MNGALKEKFKRNTFVRPLYKNVRPKNSVAFQADSFEEPDGHDFEVNRKKIRQKPNLKNVYVNISGVCDNSKEKEVKIKPFYLRDYELRKLEMLGNEVSSENPEESTVNKEVQVEKLSVPQFVPNNWLRVYPLPATPEESLCSCIIRCVVCQIGLATFIILWTVLWIFVIHSLEGPHEVEVSVKFEKAQSQLIIDLATELRQITPLSPKWRGSIEKRINEERQLTMIAISRGARMYPGVDIKIFPGQFWDLSGTFLFTIYVMTAFGSPNCSRNSDMIKTSSNGTIRRKCVSILTILCACHGVPFAAIFYYTCGGVAFGVLRHKPPVDIIMFPVEFTTGGGLEYVEGHVRLMYGLYIEGAMMLFSCSLATLRRRTSNTATYLVDKYRLIQLDV